VKETVNEPIVED
jgi:hypothetical protein